MYTYSYNYASYGSASLAYYIMFIPIIIKLSRISLWHVLTHYNSMCVCTKKSISNYHPLAEVPLIHTHYIYADVEGLNQR